MFPGLGGLGGRGGMSPKKMKGMLKNMGIDIDELENVIDVVIRMPDKVIVIENPSVAIMDSHGVRSYQISGDSKEQSVIGVVKDEPTSRDPRFGCGACGGSDRGKEGRSKGSLAGGQRRSGSGHNEAWGWFRFLSMGSHQDKIIPAKALNRLAGFMAFGIFR